MPLTIYFLDAVVSEIFVAAREMVVAEPSATVGRQRRGVYRLQYQVARRVDERSLAPGISSPEDEHQILSLCAESLYRRIGELLPSLALMARRLVCPHRQCGVEQQHTLFSPAGQISRRRYRSPVSICISLNMFCSDGGKATPSATEKLSPCACPGS